MTHSGHLQTFLLPNMSAAVQLDPMDYPAQSSAAGPAEKRAKVQQHAAGAMYLLKLPSQVNGDAVDVVVLPSSEVGIEEIVI